MINFRFKFTNRLLLGFGFKLGLCLTENKDINKVITLRDKVISNKILGRSE